MEHIVQDINQPSDIKNFRKVIESTQKLLEAVDTATFFSPFSVIPILSQALGLNTPLLGSGDSPYSIISKSLKHVDAFIPLYSHLTTESMISFISLRHWFNC